jgi:hypothetical protein
MKLLGAASYRALCERVGYDEPQSSLLIGHRKSGASAPLFLLVESAIYRQ